MNKVGETLVHAAVWVILFLTPLSFLNRAGGFSLLQYLMTCMSPLLVMLVFYANYLWLTPHYFVTGKHRYYFLTNIVMVVTLGILLHYWMDFTHQLFDSAYRPHHEPSALDAAGFIMRDIFNLTIAAAIATAIQLAMRWQKAEQARREAEAARTEAELKTLRNQINPHFLLNTLNNIYALTAIDATRAQDAIQQLSKMLRHLLYDYEQPTVPLKDEIEFLENYVNLMRIRLPLSVDVSLTTPQTAHSSVQVAPMLFISLVENAFKHGVSPTEPSFIHIVIDSDEQGITCDISNSNHPKNRQDRSGHGIGLLQVQRRLELAYPGRYTWERGVSPDGQTYRSVITLNTKLNTKH